MLNVLAADSLQLKEVVISGNKRTNNWIIEKEYAFTLGVSASEDVISEQLLTTQNRLLNTNLFNEVRVYLSPLDQSKVHIELVEKWYTWPIPFVEFSDRNFNIWQGLDFDKSRTNYGLYLFNYNLFGNDHTLKVSLIDGYHQKFGLNYAIPFLGPNTNIGMVINASYSSQNEVWYKTLGDKLQFYTNGSPNLIEEQNYSAAFTRRFRLPERVYVGGGINLTNISDSVVEVDKPIEFLLHSENKQSEIYAFASYEWDERDNRFLPMRGKYIELSAGYSNFNSEVNNVELFVKGQKFEELADKVYMAVSASYHWNSNHELPYHNYRALGYSRAVRGFEYYVIDGHSSVLLNSAIRYHLLSKPRIELPFIPIKNYNFLPLNVYLEAFIDYGRTSSDRLIVRNDLPNTDLFSTGLGVNTLFYNDRVLRFEYSLNSLQQSGFFIHFKKAI